MEGRGIPPGPARGGRGRRGRGRGGARGRGRAAERLPRAPDPAAAPAPGPGGPGPAEERLLRALGALSLRAPRDGGRLVLLRGLPGAGKSTLAR